MEILIFLNHVYLIVGFMSFLWGVSVLRKDASIADPAWALLFLVVTCSAIYQTQLSAAKVLLLICVGLWSLRLSGYLLVRNLGEEEEDYRYQEFRRYFGPHRYWWVSYFQVFLLQSSFALIAALPLHVAGKAAQPDSIGWNDWLGLGVFLVGFYFEVVGDLQLSAFRRDPNSKGKVLNTGLWRYTRHPNYFGESVMMWSFWLMSVDEPLGLAAIVGPLFMTFLLVRVSGVKMLEPKLNKTRPGYAQYVATTSSFIPWKPKQISTMKS